MSSGPPDAASMPREEDGNNARRRITYSREFLLSVGASESCRNNNKLPVGIDASLLSAMRWHWVIWDRCSTALPLPQRSSRSGAAASPGDDDDDTSSHVEMWVPLSRHRHRQHQGDGDDDDLRERAREPEASQASQTSAGGSKSKTCTRFFSTAGCPFGEGCHFLHYFPGGHQAVAKMSGGPALANHPGRMPMGPAASDGPPTPTVKTRLCNKYNTAEGCKWGDKCHFAHGERELGKHMFMDNPMPPPMGPRPTGHFAPQQMPTPGMTTPASFGASATAKISVDASLAGAIIGRGGINTKQICRVTGAKLAIRDHESDTSLKNIELEGTFDQIKNASTMVRELIVSISGNAPPPAKNPAGGSHRGGGPGSNFKTKLCENFTEGSCTFGDRCHFAHGENELRKSAAAAAKIGGAAAGRSSRWVARSAAARSLGGRQGHGDGDGEDHPMNSRERELGEAHKFMECSSMPSPHRPTPSHPAASTATAPAAASFGASATAKISVDAALAGAIIGRCGATIKRISRDSGARLRIRDHEPDAGLKNVELQGTFDQIKDASAMVVMEVIGDLIGGSHGGGGEKAREQIQDQDVRALRERVVQLR